MNRQSFYRLENQYSEASYLTLQYLKQHSSTISPDSNNLMSHQHEHGLPLDALSVMQEYVRNMNNEIFLSEHQLNGLYALLLLSRNWSWESVHPAAPNMKASVDAVLGQKIADVQLVLGGLLKIYEQKMKSSNFGWIEKFMCILKASHKNIYIHRVYRQCSHTPNYIPTARGNQHPCPQPEHHHHHDHKHEHPPKHQDKPETKSQAPQENQQSQQSTLTHPLQAPQEVTEQRNIEKQEERQQQAGPFDEQLLGVFYGISNIGALGGSGMTKCLEYNSAERYITFKMGEKYNITVKNEDPYTRDTTSQLSAIPREIFVHHILPYLNAFDLFGMRGVCKQWNQYVREAWHGTFRREMLSQLLASEFCKEIEFHYKLLQLRNPFYQKLSLLLHALIEIIQWDTVNVAVETDTVILPLKRVLVLLFKLLGEPLTITHINDITEEMWSTVKPKVANLKQTVVEYFSNITRTVLSISELKQLKRAVLDHPFIRVEQMNSEDKTPLLLVIFIKQFCLQSMLKNHIILTQEYLLNAKKRLDEISKEWPQNKNFLEVAYKILLNRATKLEDKTEKDEFNTPDFSSLLRSAFEGTENQFQKPDFVIKGKRTSTNVFLDRMTKLDIVISTIRKTGHLDEIIKQQKQKKEQQTEANENQPCIRICLHDHNKGEVGTQKGGANCEQKHQQQTPQGEDRSQDDSNPNDGTY